MRFPFSAWLPTTLLLSGWLAFAPQSRGDEGDLNHRALDVLKQHCYRCHGVEFEIPGFDVLDRPSLVAVKGNDEEKPYVVPGNSEGSALWQRVGVAKDMPPAGVKPRLTDEELSTLKSWIESGAEFPETVNRPQISEKSIIELIRSDLQKVQRADRPHQRYISLHVVANKSRFTDSDLRLHRAALAKFLNSVSRSSRIILPRAIDAPSDQPDQGYLYRIDLREFDWQEADWDKAIDEYPYGLRWNEDEIQQALADIEELFGDVNFDGIPYVRADWLIAKATRPKVYHQLLNIPDTAQELEKRLGIDIIRDFQQDRLQRAAFAGSGVSHQNRLIDRHQGSQSPYYYRSYDFFNSFGRGVLFRFPLGPRFPNNPFDQFAFDHAGGEIIWSLPNGMQGYMLVDTDGKRIDVGPIAIVRDMREIAGTPEIINGISCMGCHRHGLLDYKDAVAESSALTGEARSKVGRLFVGDKKLRPLLEADEARFMNALSQVMSPYLQVGPDKDKSLKEFPEPISTVAKWYDADMGLADVASELGFTDSQSLGGTIRLNQKLKDLGLGPLANGSTIPRRMWDTREESPASIFQRTAVALTLGSGKNPD